MSRDQGHSMGIGTGEEPSNLDFKIVMPIGFYIKNQKDWWSSQRYRPTGSGDTAIQSFEKCHVRSCVSMTDF